MPDILITPSSGNIRFSQLTTDNSASIALSANNLIVSSISGILALSGLNGVTSNGTAISISGHTHSSSDISNFNTSVSGLVSDIYAPLNSPAFTGTPLAPTAPSGTNTNQIASTAFVRTEISNLVSAAPSTLDTLNELAIALGNDANFSTTVTNNLAGKANLSGATFTGSISSPSGNFTQSLQVNGTGVSLSGHTHTVFEATSNDVSTTILNIKSQGSQIPLGFLDATDTTQCYVKGDNGGNLAFGAQAAIVFEAGGFGYEYQVAKFGSDGNVGIGIGSPAYKLDVAGTGNFRDIVAVGSIIPEDIYNAINPGSITTNKLIVNGYVSPAPTDEPPTIDLNATNGNYCRLVASPYMTTNSTFTFPDNGGGVIGLEVHSHGNITSSGTIGASGNKVLITDVDGVITTADYAPKSHILYDPTNSWDILSFTDATPVWGSEAILNDVHIQLRDSIFASPLVHSHGNINSSGQIGSVAGLVVTTSNNGLLVADRDATLECPAVFVGISGDYMSNGGMVLAPGGIVFSDNTTQETAYTGKIGSTANLPLITSASGIISTGVFGTTANSFCQGNDSRLSDSRTPLSHTHGNITNAGAVGSTANLPLITTTAGAITTGSFGSTANTFCQGNDSRLSDSRTPLSHTHGNITNAGAIGSTANLPLITTTAGAITTGSFGSSANTFCQGNDSRLSDSRTPLSHTHGNITNAGAIGATANLPLITTTAGAITVGSFGNTANSFCQGNDSRLSDTRTPTDGTVTTAKIVDANVTYAKIQNVSATDRLLGRSTAGAGVVQEITCTAFGRSLIDDADAATARTTLGLVTPSFTDTVTVTAATTFVGIRLRSNQDTTSAQSAGFVSSVNQNGIEDSNISLFRQPNGSTSINFSNTQAGSKTVDRRHTQLVISADGWWDGTVVGAVASGVKPITHCRGWVLFNGTSTPGIIGAINVSSITDNGVGDYTLNLAAAMPDTLYAIIGSANWDGQSRAAVVGQNSQRTKTATAVPIVVMQGATNTLFDTSNISVAIFR